MNTVETISCSFCRRDLGDRYECYGCKQYARDITLGLTWARLSILRSAEPRNRWSPLAVAGPCEVSHSGRGYWVIKGDVPLSVALELYADPCGKDVIRVAGHCGCPAPETPWVEWRMPDGRKVLRTKERDECEGYLRDSKSESIHKIARTILDTCEFHNDPASIGAQGFVTSYHIDGDTGLRVFVDTLIRNGLFAAAASREIGGSRE